MYNPICNAQQASAIHSQHKKRRQTIILDICVYLNAWRWKNSCKEEGMGLVWDEKFNVGPGQDSLSKHSLKVDQGHTDWKVYV